MKLALKYQKIMQENNISQSELAKRLKVSRVRVTQILNLPRLAPEIQQYILSNSNPKITERKLRSLVKIKDMELQRKKFQEFHSIKANFLL